MTTTRVAWRRTDEIETDEHCTLTLRDGGLSLVGTVLGADGGSPVREEYRVLATATGMTIAAHVRDLRGFGARTLTVERDSKGNWTVAGEKVRALKGCTDVDLGCSPSTNTLPIRRLRMAVGSSQTIRAALVQFPELTVVKSEQTYTRVDEFTYRFATGDFQSDLVVDDEGLVASYAGWRRTAVAIGRGESEPLDAVR